MFISAEYFEPNPPEGFSTSFSGVSINQKMLDWGSHQFGFHCKDGRMQHSQAEPPIVFKYSFLYTWTSGETLYF